MIDSGCELVWAVANVTKADILGIEVFIIKL